MFYATLHNRVVVTWSLTLSALTGKSPPTGPKMAIFENAYSGPKLVGDVGYGHMHCESKEIL